MLFEKQQYQTECVENIARVLRDCGDFYKNDFSNISAAVEALQNEKSFPQALRQTTDKKRLDVLMETGTGKTFVYLKTIFELNRQFGKNKFVIVTPRSAIKLGVIQNIKLTDEYFFNEYGKHLKFIDYPKDGLAKIHHDFLRSGELCVLLLTNSAFNSETNNINETAESLYGSDSTWEKIKDKGPVVIMDEPHLLKGRETEKGLGKLENSLLIRFGATFPMEEEGHRLSNVVYCLDSISAFNQHLVKRIQVNTVFASGEESPIRLLETRAGEKSYTVAYAINEEIYKAVLKKGQDIGANTGLASYTGFSARSINSKRVSLSDGKTEIDLELNTGYELSDEEISEMVRKTIRLHFEKEQSLYSRQVKVLSLFFIPKIADFRAVAESEQRAVPRIKAIFEREYKKIREEFFEKTEDEDYKGYLRKDFDEDGKLQVHEGYFSGDKDNEEEAGVDLILNQKEKLLLHSTPLRFIFSVWALQEGWDNPNVFNICKLAAPAQKRKHDTSRRQQVGRGLRIAVNQKGRRLTRAYLNDNDENFYSVNTLDMVVSAQEKEFIDSIQKEIQDASYTLSGGAFTVEKLRELGLDPREANRLIVFLEDKKIVRYDEKSGEHVMQSSVHDFMKNNKAELCANVGISEERFSRILDIFAGARQKFVMDGSRKPRMVKIKREQWQKFKTLWESISKRARMVYKGIQEDEIVEKIASQFNGENIPAVISKIITQRYNSQKDEVERVEVSRGEAKAAFFEKRGLEDFVSRLIKEEKLPASFAFKLFNKVDAQKIKGNPARAKKRLLEIAKETIHGMVINQVSYRFCEVSIYPNMLQNRHGESVGEISHTALGQFWTDVDVRDYLLYDVVCYDSKIERRIQQKVPKKFNGKTVTVFAKLPKINIPTPYKTYSPDFAYLVERENGKKLFLVVEAKGYESESKIPQEQQRRIDYAKRFFAALNEDLPEVDVVYKTRINKQELFDLLTENGLV